MPLTPEQKAEIDRLRAETAPTRRATVPALEEILYDAIPVLEFSTGPIHNLSGGLSATINRAIVGNGLYGSDELRYTYTLSQLDLLEQDSHTRAWNPVDLSAWPTTGEISPASSTFRPSTNTSPFRKRRAIARTTWCTLPFRSTLMISVPCAGASIRKSGGRLSRLPLIR